MRLSLDAERRAMALDLPGDRPARPLAEPVFEDSCQWPAVGRGKLDLEHIPGRIPAAYDMRSAAPGHGGYDPDEMRLSPVRDRGAIGQRTARRDRRPLAAMAIEMAHDPRLTLAQECIDLRERRGPGRDGQERSPRAPGRGRC